MASQPSAGALTDDGASFRRRGVADTSGQGPSSQDTSSHAHATSSLDGTRCPDRLEMVRPWDLGSNEDREALAPSQGSRGYTTRSC